MRLALDTNRYTDLCRGDVSVVETVERAEQIWLPFIVLGEFLLDSLRGPKDRGTKLSCGVFS